MVKTIDAYDNLIEKIGVDIFFKIGVDSIIYIEDNAIKEQWSSLKKDILENKPVYIRGYGRDAAKTNYFVELYKFLFKNENIQKDSTNNAQPTKLISTLTQYSKVNDKNRIKIQNYQISHLFGKTKNPLLFNCSWNIAYIPKYIDPFTGHETQGSYRDRFKKEFNLILKKRFTKYISDYNIFIDKYVTDNLEDCLIQTKNKLKIDDTSFVKFRNDAKSELSIISI